MKTTTPTLFPPQGGLIRYRATVIDALPSGAIINKIRTPWQSIAEMLANNEGMWLELHRKYSNPSNAVSSARKALEADYGADAAERLESAYEPVVDDKYRVFLRLVPAETEDGDDEE